MTNILLTLNMNFFTVVGLKEILRRKNQNPCDFIGLSRHTGSLATQGETLSLVFEVFPN